MSAQISKQFRMTNKFLRFGGGVYNFLSAYQMS